MKSKIALLRIENFLNLYSNVKIKISGNDLKALGIKPGPVYSKLLSRVLHKKLEGEIKTKKDEINLVKKLIIEVM